MPYFSIPGFLTTYWMLGAIGQSILRRQKTQSWLSHSHDWVCHGPEHSRRFFSCRCLQMDLLKTRLFVKGLTAKVWFYLEPGFRQQACWRRLNCEQRVNPWWRWRCGGFSKLQVHAANVLASALVCTERCVAHCRPRRLHLMCFGVVARKFCNLTLVSLFVQASRSQEDTQESTTPHLLKHDACDWAILLTFVGVFVKFKLCVYIYLFM